MADFCSFIAQVENNFAFKNKSLKGLERWHWLVLPSPAWGGRSVLRADCLYWDGKVDPTSSSSFYLPAPNILTSTMVVNVVVNKM